MTVETRPATPDDAAALCKLSLLLGYETSAETMRHRIKALDKSGGAAVFVAVHPSDGVVGWVHITRQRRLTSDAFGEIVGLVVVPAFRRKGVGRVLLNRVMMWSESHGVADIRVRVQAHRRGAHNFYESMGYTLLKDQRVYHRHTPVPDADTRPTLVD